MEKNPIESSHIAFRAGGNGVPILTRASASSTTGYQTNGLPDGSKPMPGGGANKTTLGAFRMGDQDGNAPASAIYNGDIFGPFGQPDRVYPERTFPNVGNNVYQPENNDLATYALLKRLGDQKFKAVADAPFEAYRAEQRLAKDLEEASRNASLSDLGISREIIRNLAAQRRQQNEDDYLRKMLDAGATPEAARKEIEDVRNANALQEAKKVDDREYQAKTLIQRMAMARGVTPMVREPLNQSSSIDNPQRSQAMSQAMGMPGEGFGTSPLDMNRQFMTADFYKKFLRRSMVSQEAGDEQQAFNNMLTEGEIPAPPQGAFSMATMRGQERQQQVEMASEALASRLDTLRQRAVRMKLPLPAPIVAKEILDLLYKSKGKSAGNRVIYSPETIQDMNPIQLLLAINWSVQHEANGFNNLKRELGKYTWGTEAEPSKNLVNDLKKVAYALNKGNYDIRIPFPSSTVPFTSAKLVSILNDIKTTNSPELRREIEQGRVDLMREINLDDVPFTGETIQLVGGGGGRSRRPSVAGMIGEAVAGNPMAQPQVPGAPGLTREQVDAMSKEQVKTALQGKNVAFRANQSEKKLKDLLKANLG
jgi:uncharacterized protein YjiS (DUF1127 family)